MISPTLKRGSPLMVLATNLFRKDMENSDSHPLAASMALEAAATIADADLASELISVVVPLTKSTRTILRQRACVALLRLTLSHPASIATTFPIIAELLSDPDYKVRTHAGNSAPSGDNSGGNRVENKQTNKQKKKKAPLLAWLIAIVSTSILAFRRVWLVFFFFFLSFFLSGA